MTNLSNNPVDLDLLVAASYIPPPNKLVMPNDKSFTVTGRLSLTLTLSLIHDTISRIPES